MRVRVRVRMRVRVKGAGERAFAGSFHHLQHNGVGPAVTATGGAEEPQGHNEEEVANGGKRVHQRQEHSCEEREEVYREEG